MVGEPLRIAINHTIHGNPLLLDSLRYELSTGERYSLTRLSYLISGLSFETETGDWIEAEGGIGYIDLKKRLLNFECELPKNSYRAVRFDVGLDATTNHCNPATYPPKHPLNPDFNQLHWTWSDGYIFMALEGRFYDEEQRLSGFVYHYANDANRVTVNLPIQLDHMHQSLVELNLDVGQLLQFPSQISFRKDGQSTHSHQGDVISEKLKGNLPGVFRVAGIGQTTLLAKPAPPPPIDMPAEFTAYPFTIGSNFPRPDLPLDNPLIEERIRLGEALFFDPRLSKNRSISCASCHEPSQAFSDDQPQSIGVSGNPTRRHSMPLFNLAWKDAFFWDGRVQSLREQIFHPIEHPDEMGFSDDELLVRLQEDPTILTLFAQAFSPGTITREHISLALENYLLTLVSYDSKFDAAMLGKAVLTDSEKRGFELFMTEYEPRSRRYGADCFHCHGCALFTDNQFHNNGLLPGTDTGRSEFTGLPSDDFKFSTPSLRNVALTAPYMHDASLDTLEAVIEHYDNSIHYSATLDPNLLKHPRDGIQLSSEDKQALVDFLMALSDPKFSEID